MTDSHFYGIIQIMEQDELRRIIKQGETSTVQFKQNGLLFADEMIIPGSSIDDIDTDKIKVYLEKIDDSEIDIPPEQLYKNLNILNNGRLTLGGLMFFAKKPQKYRPAFCIKAVSFFGNDISGTDYRENQQIQWTGTSAVRQKEGVENIITAYPKYFLAFQIFPLNYQPSRQVS